MITSMDDECDDMKMYYFSSGGYGEEYHVMAKSKNDALLYLKRYCSEMDSKCQDELMKTYYTSQYKWFKQNLEHIYEYSEGRVIRTEVS